MSAPHQASVFGSLLGSVGEGAAEPVKANHQVPVVRITDILPHTNADTLEIIRTLGYQTIVKKGDFKVGDLAVFVQPDSVVPEIKTFEWLWGDAIGPIPVRRRRIKAKKLRGEWSEGLLLPITDFPELTPDVINGRYDVAPLLGITHYNPPEDVETDGTSERGPQLFVQWLAAEFTDLADCNLR
jgi:RNA ligase (TIGR02306 family)